jgi:DNA-binding MarR family transcriptional regulator
MSSRPETAGLTRAAAGPELAAALGRLHRALRRRVRDVLAGPALPQSQVEILRLLLREPGLRAREIADNLGLASNTVSTLLQQLSRKGFVTREVDSRDRRSARLTLTDAAVTRMNSWSDMRSAVLGAGLESLPAADYECIIASLPALEKLAGLLEGAHHGT